MLKLKSLKVLVCWYSEAGAHDSSDALNDTDNKGPQAGQPVPLPNTTLSHYHHTNLLLYFALFMGRDKNVGNKQNLVLYQKRGMGLWD